MAAMKEELIKIQELTQMECARLVRFAPAGHKYFDLNKPFHEAFAAHFRSLGGMTPTVSKELGWDE